MPLPGTSDRTPATPLPARPPIPLRPSRRASCQTPRRAPRPSPGRPARCPHWRPRRSPRRSPWRSWRPRRGACPRERAGRRAGWRPGAGLLHRRVIRRRSKALMRGAAILAARLAACSRWISVALRHACRSLQAATRQAGEQCRAGRPRGSLRTCSPQPGQNHGHQPTGHLQDFRHTFRA